MDPLEGSSSDAARCNKRARDGTPLDAVTEAGENNTVGACSPDTRTASAENVGALSPDTAAEANRCLFELRWALSGTLITRMGDEWENRLVGLLMLPMVLPLSNSTTMGTVSRSTDYFMKAPKLNPLVGSRRSTLPRMAS